MTWRLARTGILHAFARREHLSLCGFVRRANTLPERAEKAENVWLCTGCRRVAT